MDEEILLPSLCPLTRGTCSLNQRVIEERLSIKPYVFAALLFDEKFNDTEAGFKITIEGGELLSEYYPKEINGNRLRLMEARDQKFDGNGTCKICQLCWFSDFAIAEIATLNPNVIAEVGLLWGFGKRIIFTLHIGYTRISEIPFDLRSFLFVPHQSIFKLIPDLEDKVRYVIRTL